MVDWGASKPLLTALALPPVPFLVLVLVGARLILPRRGWGYALLLLGVAGLWFSSCQKTALWLQQGAMRPPPALFGAEQQRLEEAGRAHQAQGRCASKGATTPPPAAIIVLGGGLERLAPEFGVSALSPSSERRLTYGVWLSRQTGLPLGFSGGVGWAQQGGQVGSSEAEVAARMAERLHGMRMTWVEGASSDTRENAQRTVALLAPQGVREIVLVTDAAHMPRAQRAFIEATRKALVQHPEWPIIRVTPAPVAYWRPSERPLLDWLPSTDGVSNVRQVLREWLGWLAGA